MMKTRLLVAALFCAAAATTTFAQNNLGQDCGCPAVSARTSVNMSTLVVNATTDPELSADVHLTCDKIWVLDQKVYVPKGKTITIDPGTVIKGLPTADPALAATLIVERGGKIMADGTKDCPIVFTTTEDPMDGSYSLTNVSKFGGLVICGIATNNLTFAGNGPSKPGLCVVGDGIGYLEGFTSANAFNHFGAGPADPDPSFQAFNDNDNSGILRYVSVRHSGAIIAAGSGNEINGITLASVGRGTTIEHVEVVAGGDDGMEFFGGTVNVKYASAIFGDDDMFDTDLGYTGKLQFLFGIAADSLNTGNLHTADNGFEADADDQKAATAISNHSHAVIYNATIIGNGHVVPTADNTGPAAIMAKELVGGEIYNSVFANFRSGLHLSRARSTAADLGDAYDQWTSNPDPAMTKAQAHTFIVKNNTFVNCGAKNTFGTTSKYPITKGIMASGKNPPVMQQFTPPSAADTAQFFTTDGNVAVVSLLGIDGKMGFNATNSVMTDPFHAIPTVNLPSSITPPSDGFFSTVKFRGAFDASKGSWLSDWAQGQVQTLQNSNPTDLNGDGVTDVADLNILLARLYFLDK
jgi:hypothetical protein